jgi:hypothetical protein
MFQLITILIFSTVKMEVNIKLVNTTWMDMMRMQIKDTNFMDAYFMAARND